MTTKKEAIEIRCPGCDVRFRLWIPEEQIGEWESGQEISCIKCGVKISVRKGGEGFETFPTDAEKAEEAVPADAAARPVEETPEDEDTILLVEDDKLSREMARQTLTESGFNVVTAKNGPEALEKFKSRNIKLIVTDLYLKNPNDPESSFDGEELLKKLVDKGIHLPSIVTTGRDMIDDMITDPKWFDLHVKGFIQKGNPFWIDDLKAKIKEILFRY